MPQSQSTWFRDLVIIPLIVAVVSGVVVGVVTYLIPKLAEKGSQLSYTVDRPTLLLHSQLLGNITVTINGEPTSELYMYRADIWNSGDLPLRDVPVRLVFAARDSGFRIFSIIHSTAPRFEFGQIADTSTDSMSTRFKYQLLNPRNRDLVTVLTNQDPSLMLYSKTEGMQLKPVEPRKPQPLPQRPLLIGSLTALAGALSSLLGLVLRRSRPA